MNKSNTKRLLIIRAISILAILTFIVFVTGMFQFYSYLKTIKPEYGASGSISKIKQYVNHNKSWPKGWTALNQKPIDGVTINWGVQIQSATQKEILNSVRIDHGTYRTYPHADDQLNDLWNTIYEIQTMNETQQIAE